MFLVPFGSFSGSGGGSVPVEGFATFYITGWGGNGNGHSDPCPIGPAWPAAPVDGKDDSAGAGYVVGHFVKYISALNTGGGTQPCNPTSLNTCVAVLTQ